MNSIPGELEIYCNTNGGYVLSTPGANGKELAVNDEKAGASIRAVNDSLKPWNIVKHEDYIYFKNRGRYNSGIIYVNNGFPPEKEGAKADITPIEGKWYYREEHKE